MFAHDPLLTSKFVKYGYIAQGNQKKILEEVKEIITSILKEDIKETYEEYYNNVINVWKDCADLIPLSANKPRANIRLEKVLREIETRRYPGTYEDALKTMDQF